MTKARTIDMKVWLTAGTILLLLWLLALNAGAVAPHPQLLERTTSGQQTLPYYMQNVKKLHTDGISTGENVLEKALIAAKSSAAQSGQITGTFNVLAVLVRFSDNASSTGATLYDSLLFDSSGGITLWDYYNDASYGQLDVVTVDLPSTTGWNMAPETYAYYVNNENGINPASYPHNAQKLVEDLVTIVDPAVDFSRYDNDDNGLVDVLIVIHAGPGAEVTGLDTDIWSHKWAIYPRLTGEGVYVSTYTMQPEYIFSAGDMTIGVFAHELGHAFGLPDLYDTDYSSNGIGTWCIMASGSWLGPGFNGGRPAQPSAWSRAELGFASPVDVIANVDAQPIQDVKTSGEIYKLAVAGGSTDEYFLVENRQKTGYDTYLPASGLLIWHIDESKSDNDQEWYPGLSAADHYLVALEQADGLYDLEHGVDYGDNSDVFPGSYGTTDFDALSTPTSNTYVDGASQVAVQNISGSAAVMYADFRVALSSGTDDDFNPSTLPFSIELAQNYPNPFNPITTIEFETSASARAVLVVYNLLGRKVKTVLDGVVPAGITRTTWDATDETGQAAASGVYIYKLEINDQEQTKKMVLVR